MTEWPLVPTINLWSNEALINRTRTAFGQEDSDGLFNTGELQATIKEIQEAAKDARSRQRNPKAQRSEWSRINTRALSVAISKVCKTSDPELNEPLSLCQNYTELARTTGDDMAHPNPFVALQVLDLIDPDTENIRRTSDVTNRLLNPTCLLMLVVQLLILHIAAIAKHDPKCISLRKILETLGKAWLREKRNAES